MNLKDMQARQAAILTEQAAVADEGNEERYNELQTEFDTLTTDIDTAETRATQIAANKALVVEREARAAKIVTKPLALVSNGRVEVSNENRAMFPTMGDQALEIYFRAKNNGRNKMGGVYEARASHGYNESSDDQGGMLVQEDLSIEMATEAIDGDTGILSRMSRQDLSGNSLKIVRPVDYDFSSASNGVGQVYWVGEAGAITPSKGKTEARRYELKKAGMILPITDDLLADSAAMGSFINAEVPGKLNRSMVNKAINGNDPATMSGILHANALIEVPKEGSQDSDTVVFENVLKMYSRMLPSSLSRAEWLISGDVMLQLQQMNLAVGTGGLPVFLPPGMAAAAPNGALLGRPITITQFCPKLGDKGDMIFADLSKYKLARKVGEEINVAVSIHFYFDTMENAFRFYVRVDGAVYPSQAYTPANGGSTVSPFVTLAERT